MSFRQKAIDLAINNLAKCNKNRIKYGCRATSYRGVAFCRSNNRYYAQCINPDVGMSIKRYKNTELEAAIEYDKMATDFQGDTAVTNKMMGLL